MISPVVDHDRVEIASWNDAADDVDVVLRDASAVFLLSIARTSDEAI